MHACGSHYSQAISRTGEKEALAQALESTRVVSSKQSIMNQRRMRQVINMRCRCAYPPPQKAAKNVQKILDALNKKSAYYTQRAKQLDLPRKDLLWEAPKEGAMGEDAADSAQDDAGSNERAELQQKVSMRL